MAATETRLMVLATVMDLEPATGYAVVRRLTEQRATAWGEVSVSSVYSVLRTLTKHGSLEAVGDPTGVRAQTVAYRLTAAGRAEFRHRWRAAAETVVPTRPLAFHVAITLTALVPRPVYVAALATRLARLEAQGGPLPAAAPPQTRLAAGLWRALADTEATWLREAIELAERPDNPLGFP